jgi:hypothetical protein
MRTEVHTDGLTERLEWTLRRDSKATKWNVDIIFFPNGLTASWGPRPPHFSRLYDRTLDTPHSVGLLWTSDQPDAETST